MTETIIIIGAREFRVGAIYSSRKSARRWGGFLVLGVDSHGSVIYRRTKGFRTMKADPIWWLHHVGVEVPTAPPPRATA